MLLQCVSNGVDHAGVGQHAQLYRVNVEIVETGIQLRAQEVDRRHMHGDDATRVLCGQCGDCGEAVHAMRGEGFQVGLDARPSTGVGAGDGESGNGSGRAHSAIVPWSRRGR